MLFFVTQNILCMLCLSVFVFPEQVFLIPNLCDVVFLPCEAVPEKCKHPPHPNDLCSNFLHIVL